MSLKPKYEKEEVLHYAELFRQLEASPAWPLLLGMVEGMRDQVVKAGLSMHETPAKVSYNAGFYDALGVLVELPEKFKAAAQAYQKEDEQERLEAEIREKLRIIRGVEGGEVSI